MATDKHLGIYLQTNLKFYRYYELIENIALGFIVRNIQLLNINTVDKNLARQMEMRYNLRYFYLKQNDIHICGLLIILTSFNVDSL